MSVSSFLLTSNKGGIQVHTSVDESCNSVPNLEIIGDFGTNLSTIPL